MRDMGRPPRPDWYVLRNAIAIGGCWFLTVVTEHVGTLRARARVRWPSPWGIAGLTRRPAQRSGTIERRQVR